MSTEQYKESSKPALELAENSLLITHGLVDGGPIDVMMPVNQFLKFSTCVLSMLVDSSAVGANGGPKDTVTNTVSVVMSA